MIHLVLLALKVPYLDIFSTKSFRLWKLSHTFLLTHFTSQLVLANLLGGNCNPQGGQETFGVYTQQLLKASLHGYHHKWVIINDLTSITQVGYGLVNQ
jgi:hypothetical protein